MDDASVLQADKITVDEDHNATGNVLTNDQDVDNVLSVTSFNVTGVNGNFTAGQTATITGVGTLIIASNGDYTFKPAADWNGNVPQVTYTTNTGSSSTLNISVTPVNDNFTDTSETVSSPEDVVATGSVLTGTSSVDGPVSVVNFTIGETSYAAGTTATIANVGTLKIAANGAYTFTPVENYNGTVPTASYTVTNGSGSDVTSTLKINVTPVNDNFTDASEMVSIPEDTVAIGSVLNGTSSVDGPVSVVSFTIGNTTYAAGSTATIANVGTLVIATNGVYTFTPAENYNGGGLPSVRYTVTDGSGSNETSHLKIHVTPIDDSFTDTSETVATNEDTAVTGSLLSGTNSVDGPASVVNFTVGGTQYLAGETATIANVGTLVIGANGVYTFTPDANYNGTVPTVSYSVTDGSGTDVTSTLNLSVAPIDDNFTDTSETVATNEDTAVSGSVLIGTSSGDGTVSVVNFTIGDTTYAAGSTASIANVGALVLGANGVYTFTPAENYNGAVPTVSYSVTDGSGSDVTSTLNISVTPVDDPSVLTADTNTVLEDNNASGNVLTNDLDVDNALSVATFTVGGTEYTAGGTATIENVGKLTLGANGNYSFTPVDNWSGDVPTVTYTTNTGSSTTLDIGVTAVADKPTILAITPDVTSTGLTEQVWAPGTALYNALGSGGNGATAATLIAGINSATANVTPAKTTTVHDFASSANVDQGTATKASGLIYLEAGKTYDFAGHGDDSLAVTVGGNTVASATWGNQSGTISGIGFTPAVSGYYTLDIYHFNQNGPGNYNLTVSVNGGAATSLSGSNLLTFTSVEDIADAGLTVSDLHGLNGEGYYTVSSINHGQENTFIKVSPITTTYTDNDGSETHVTTLSGIPVGSVLMDGTGKSITVSSATAVDLSGWDTKTLSIKPPTDWTGTINLTVTATATEKSNSSVASDVAHIDVTVDATNDAPVAANSSVQGTEDTPLTLTWNNLHVSDADTAASKLSIIVTQLPSAGKLIYNDGTGWKDVTVDTVISKSIIDSNGLVFVPVAHQSGDSNYTNAGLGDQKTDYAQFQFQPFDGADKGAVAIVTLDIAPAVDAPIVSATHTQVVENESVALGLKVTSLDTDGSETQVITTIGGIPVGATLTDGTHTFTGTTGSAVADLSGWDVSKLSYTPAPYTNGTNTLTVTAVSTESHTSQSLTTTTPLNITVTAGVYDHQDGKPGTDALTGTASNDILVGDSTGTIVVEGKSYNIAFILDSSGSMEGSLETAKAQLKTVFDQLATNAGKSSSGTVNLYLLDFDTNAGKSVAIDLSNKDDAMTKLNALLNSIEADGVTNYEDAFKTTANWFHSDLAQSNVGATNLTFFITDGQPNYYQSTTSTVIDYKNGTDKVLSDYIGQWIPGTALNVSFLGKQYTLISADGDVYKLVEKSFGNSGKPNIIESEYLGILSHADGYGGTEYSLTTGMSSSTDAINNAQEGYDALSKVSTVQAIGINSDINKDTLQLFDTDHVVQTGVNAGDLASTIQGSAASIAPGDDNVNGGNGHDILFGDLVSFNGISGDGVQAIQAFVAQKSGVADASLVTDQQMHQYITNHISEFNVTGTSDGKDTLLGDDGNDILFGQGGNDTLYGGNGNDTLIGGRGDDELSGGSGADTFTWLKGDTGNDVIQDFKPDEGDRIDLRDLLQGETDSTINNFLKITTVEGVSTLQVSSEGKLNAAGGLANADTTIKLEGNNWTGVSVNSLISGGDPTIKVDHNNS